MKILSALLCLLGSASAGLVYETVYYDFVNGCEGLSMDKGPLRLNGILGLEGDVYVVSALTYQVARISEDETGMRRCSLYGYIPSDPEADPDAVGPMTFSLGIKADPSGNIYITNTGAGPASSEYGSIWKLPVDAVERPIKAQRLSLSEAQFGLPSGIVVDWRHFCLLYSSETDGTIYRMKLSDNSVSIWAQASAITGFGRTPGQSPDASITNTNLLAIPIGPTGMTISVDGKTLYVGSGDQGRLVSIAIDPVTGDAGAIAIVGSSPDHTVEGVVVSPDEETAFFSAVFANGTNLTPDSESGEYQGGVLPGRSIWISNIDTGASTRFYDERLGCITGLMSARGVVDGGATRLLAVISALDSLPFWPMGQVRSGAAPYPNSLGTTTGSAFPDLPYNGKIVQLKIV